MIDMKEDQPLWFVNFLIKNLQVVVSIIIIPNKIYNQLKNYTNQLVETLKREQFILQFINSLYNTWGTDLADMQLISKFNKGFRYFLCNIDIFSNNAWVVPLKGKKGVSIVNPFQKIFKKSNRKPIKIWVNKGSEFYNNTLKKWLKGNDIEMY